MHTKPSFYTQVRAYCRENGLSVPTDLNRLSIHREGVELLLVGEEGDDIATVWADLGQLKDYQDEESVLLVILTLSSALSPLQGFFIGLDARSQRLMLRAKFALADSSDAKPLSTFLAKTAKQVKQWKDCLSNQRALV